MPGREVVPDTRPLLEATGIEVISYEPLASWAERAIPTYRAILANRQLFASVFGPWFVAEAEWGVDHGERSMHVLIVGERKASWKPFMS